MQQEPIQVMLSVIEEIDDWEQLTFGCWIICLAFTVAAGGNKFVSLI
jgi:hypothetical protein